MGTTTERTRVHLPDCLAAAGVVGAWTHDIATDRVVADKGVAALFGIVRPDACNGDPLAAYVEAIHPADLGGFCAEVESASRRGAPIALQYRVQTGDGVRVVRDYGSFSLDGRGRPIRGQGIVIDATGTRPRDAAEAVAELAASRVPDATLSREVTMLADHVIAVSEIARALPSSRLRALTDPLLWEVGRLLAWTMSRRGA
ncbi:PAS domain-containing protein [Methylobacterium sp. D54C]